MSLTGSRYEIHVARKGAAVPEHRDQYQHDSENGNGGAH